jgi:hypothetical protein
MAFGNNGGGHEHESTEIADAPAERPSERTDPVGQRRNRDDW